MVPYNVPNIGVSGGGPGNSPRETLLAGANEGNTVEPFDPPSFYSYEDAVPSTMHNLPVVGPEAKQSEAALQYPWSTPSLDPA